VSVPPSSLELPGTAAPVPAGDPALALRDVSVHFGGVAALSEVNLDVAAGEVVAVVGPNGAGKSTLLNAVSGLLGDRVSGTVLLAGRDVRGMSASQIARLGVGRSFQDPPLLDDESATTNVLVGQHLRLGYPLADQLFRPRRVNRIERAAAERAAETLAFVGLGHLAEQPVAGLAYGTRKLIDIARAIASEPQLLLLDEPTSGLDRNEQQAVATMLMQLHQRSPLAVLVVEHHMEVVRSVATKVAGLHSGSVLMIGTPSEVLDSQEFLDAVTGRVRLADGGSPGDQPDPEVKA
jgi:branched-chain amino acid transport system ATP-binding protein